ncbi:MULTISPECIES: hypothetical protein [Bacillus cereus group]|uniref:hypothetical protein n=1 Tax=Bacillus cereus group TaxID=86661 RepID=UPI0022E8D9A7|nr:MULTISPECIES: hypothetical protein [Bacillus cereus group]MDA1620650.1 hypothetical protein [Bacillus cereus group sp. TH204-1LC]
MEQKKMGRPRVPKHRSKTMRLAKVEDQFLKVLSMMESKKDKKLVLEALEELRG